MGFRTLEFWSRHPAIQTTGLLTFAPAGLSPAEHTSLYWSQLPDCQISRVRFHTLACHDRPSQGLERLKRWFVSTPPLLVCLQPRLLSAHLADALRHRSRLSYPCPSLSPRRRQMT